MSAVLAGVSEVLIKYTGKYVKIYFIIKITYFKFIWVNSAIVWNIVKRQYYTVMSLSSSSSYE